MNIRKSLFGTVGAAMILLGHLGPAQAQEIVLRVSEHAGLRNLDPIVTTAAITLNHAYKVYDTLFALDAEFNPQPQMVEEWSVSPDGLVYDFTLREGLLFSDGSPVEAADAVASIERWGKRNSEGRAMMERADGLEVVDARRFRLKLNRPYGRVLESLAAQLAPFVMREEEARTDPAEPVKEVIGSGPFLFVESEWDPGNRAVYVKNPDYKPRSEPPSGLAGGKVAMVDRIEVTFIPDPDTAANALVAGEIDIFEQVPIELAPTLGEDPNIEIMFIDKIGSQAMLRPNSLVPPFNDPRARQALMHMVDQEVYMAAVVGNPDFGGACLAPFGCGTPSESMVGTEPFAKPDLDRARELLKEAGYNGEPIVVMDPTDRAYVHNMALVTAARLRDIGVNVDLQAVNWTTLQSRGMIKDPPSENPGGWHILHTNWPAFTQSNPIANAPLAASCDGNNWNGWPCDEELERLRLAYLDAGTPEERKQAIEALQKRYFEVIPYVPLGQYQRPLAHRTNIVGLRPAIHFALWGVEKQ